MSTAVATGRPSLYNQQLADKICELIAEGRSVVSVCSLPGMPCSASIYKWLSEQPYFSERYARAREVQLEVMAAELVDIADDSSQDRRTIVVNGHEIEIVDQDHINRARLRVDTRKWLLSKLAPKKYGDRLELAGDQEAPLTITVKRTDIP